MVAGSATAFFAYIGFDAVASTAEEVYNMILYHVSCKLTSLGQIAAK